MLKHESKYEAVLLVCIVRAQARVCAVMALLLQAWTYAPHGSSFKLPQLSPISILTGNCRSSVAKKFPGVASITSRIW